MAVIQLQEEDSFARIINVVLIIRGEQLLFTPVSFAYHHKEDY